MKNLFFTLFVTVFVSSAFVSKGIEMKNILGSWKIEVPEAPYEYVNSTMVVSEKDGKIQVKLVLTDNTSITGDAISFDGITLKFKMDIDGNEIPFSGKIEGEKLTGSVDSPDGTISVKGQKVPLTGSWLFNAPDAPYEYSTGKIVFNEINGKPTGKVILSGGYDVPVTNLKLTKTSFTFAIDVEGETVNVSGELLNGKLKGKAETSQGTMAIEASK